MTIAYLTLNYYNDLSNIVLSSQLLRRAKRGQQRCHLAYAKIKTARKRSCENINFCENKTHPAFTCWKALSSFEFVHTRKVATKIFNIANLSDILDFKLAANNRTQQRPWKTDKIRIQYCLSCKER